VNEHVRLGLRDLDEALDWPLRHRQPPAFRYVPPRDRPGHRAHAIPCHRPSGRSC
jgi:hypothetical protein